MEIKIKETGEVVSLNLVDPQTGSNWIYDFVGNAGALSDGQFVRKEGLYYCDQATYDWWENIVNQEQNLSNRIHALKAEHGSNAVQNIIQNVGTHDIEEMSYRVNEALDAAFE